MARPVAISSLGHRTVRQGSARAMSVIRRSGLHLIAIVGGGLLMIPFAWAVISSLKPWNEIRILPPTFWPSHFAWSNYPEVWSTQYFSGWVFNSVEISILATIGTVITAALAGFAFARLRFPGRNQIGRASCRERV